ncbi:MAG: thioredoxin [Lachnoclostridium sp.]|nr:thioredoxin [Lachnospira sp.]MCM1248214.1 thioredoxin [Lachnoclostridium sp.]MCM1534998.1 thioredoxin [Clostridium sp.]
MEHTFTTENFEKEVLQSELPVLVDFYADWCGPCKKMAPIVEGLAEKTQGKLKVGKCDVSANMPLAQKYRVANIPAFKIFKNGEVIADMIGAMDGEEFFEKVKEAVL